jgi:hypothetical protein
MFVSKERWVGRRICLKAAAMPLIDVVVMFPAVGGLLIFHE